MAGAIQRAAGTPLVYGFWVPEGGARPFLPVGGPFGPFINRNHFAGWMLLAIPLGLAYFVQRIGWARVPPDLRRRVLWLQTTEGTEALWTGTAVCLMVLGLMLTLSRSGIAVFAAMLVAALFIGLCRRGTRLKALGAASLVAVVVSGLVVRAGSDVLLTRFERASRDFAGRQRTWSDAVRIFSDFTITGTGTNTYDQATLFYEPPGLEAHYAQAHNDYLQLLAESGVIGGVTFAALVAAIAWASWRRFVGAPAQSRVLRAGGLAGLAALAQQEVVDFSLHMPANALLAIVAIGVVVAPNAPNDSPARRPSRGR
jgi:putative inorganic carbon (HCO3(-)) transporter